jgi:hypothetical protein
VGSVHRTAADFSRGENGVDTLCRGPDGPTVDEGRDDEHMAATASPATIVVSADVPRKCPPAALQAWLARPATSPVSMTWVMDDDALVAAADSVRSASTRDVAVRIDPAWLDSKLLLRRRLAAARAAVPNLVAAVHRGPRPLVHRDILVEEGFRIVMVDALDPGRRASRRPAPAGWPCRNLAWGLWEVMIAPRGRGGLLAWLWQGGSLPRPTPGSLRLLHAGGTDLTGGVGPSSVRLERWLAWAARRAAAGAAAVIPLTDLADVLARGGQPLLGGSVLKAA